jgi:hypothetical protein
MTSVAEIGQALKRVLTETATQAARATGFVQRASKLTGAGFVQTTVLGWLQNPNASLSQLSQVAAALGISLSPQGLDQRFSKESAALLAAVFHAALAQVIAAEPVAIPLLRRFRGVILQDSSVINLPPGLAEVFRGCGGSNGQSPAALKAQVRFDFLTGSLSVPQLDHGRTHDRSSAVNQLPLPAGALRLSDLGYFRLSALAQCMADQAFFLTRMLGNTAVFERTGTRCDLLRLLQSVGPGPLDRPILLGVHERLPVRLIAVGVPQEVLDQRRRRLRDEGRRRSQTVSKTTLALAAWTILVTNVAPEQLSVPEALVLGRVRWQIELVFKLWKQHGRLDAWRSAKPWRVLTEIYAKLTALIIQHWLCLVSFWGQPDRSLVKASATIRSSAPLLVSALAGVIELSVALEQIERCLQSGCRLNSRLKHPDTYQLLLNLPHAS